MQFPSTIYVKMFADKCLKMKLLMIYELYHAELKKNVIYIMVSWPFLRASWVDFLY